MDLGPQNDTMSPRLNTSISGAPARSTSILPGLMRRRGSQQRYWNPMGLCNEWQRGGACVDRLTRGQGVSRVPCSRLGPVGRGASRERARILRRTGGTSARPCLDLLRVGEQSRRSRRMEEKKIPTARKGPPPPNRGTTPDLYTPFSPPPRQPTLTTSLSTFPTNSAESERIEPPPRSKEMRDRGCPVTRTWSDRVFLSSRGRGGGVSAVPTFPVV